MANYLSDWLVFLWAVLNNWAGYVTGGIIVALVTTWWNVLKNKPIPRRVLIGLTTVFLVLGVFNAWRAQLQRVKALEGQEQRPKFALIGSGLAEVSGKNPKTNDVLARY